MLITYAYHLCNVREESKWPEQVLVFVLVDKLQKGTVKFLFI